jgi:hypothetical protein
MKNQCAFALSFLVIVLPLFTLFAQAPDTLWTKTFGGSQYDYPCSMQITADNGYIIVGFTDSFGAGYGDVYLIKTDAYGNTEWERTYGGNGWDHGYDVKQTRDGGYIVCGYTQSFAIDSIDIWLLKIDGSGDTVWTRTYGGPEIDAAISVIETSDSFFVAVGTTESFGSGYQDLYLIKVNANGDSLWTKVYGGIWNDVPEDIQETSDGSFIITGTTASFGAIGANLWLLKTDANGDSFWTKTYGGVNWDRGYEIRETSDNGYIIAGLTETPGSGWFDVWLVKTDINGDTSWTKKYGGPDDDEARSIQVVSDGGYIVTGNFDHGSYSGDVYLLRTDANGDTLWTTTFGGQQWERGIKVRITSDGGYIIVAETYSYGAGNEDILLLKTEPDPSCIEEKHMDRPHPKILEVKIAPNPFSSNAQIWFSCEDMANICLTICDVSGRIVREFSWVASRHHSGNTFVWRGEDNFGNPVRDGIYFVKANGQTIGKLIKIHQ